jgi:hypothetical protein
MNIQSIQQALAPLVGLPFRRIGRASNLVWLQFGELHETSDRHGGTKVVGDWVVHIGCPWRLVRHNRILVGYRDFYYTPDGDALEDWDVVGKTRFDFIASTLCGEFAKTPPLAVAVQPDDVGGFCVRLRDDYRVDVFPDESDETCEHWRIFQPGVCGKHFVFHESVA